MVSRHHLLAAGAALALALFHPVAVAADALVGTVTSAEEGAMEGVLVSAKREGSNKTITVVSDEKGRYRFPAARLEPGKYTITIRAVGYDLADASSPQVTAQGRRDRRSQARQDEGPCVAALECRVAPQRARHGAAETAAPLLRRLPHARQDHALAARRRRLRGDDTAHGHLRQPEHLHQSAETADRPRHRRRRRGAREAAADERRVLRLHQPEPRRSADGWTVRVEDLRPPEGPRDARHHHGMGPAAPDDTAARRGGRFEGHGVVHRFQRPEHRQVRSEDGQARGDHDARAEEGLAARRALDPHGPRREPVARHDVPGGDRQARHEDREAAGVADPRRVEPAQHAGQHDEPAQHRRRRQGVERRTTASPACIASISRPASGKPGSRSRPRRSGTTSTT